MRLKEDKSSWHSSGIIHRDYRHTSIHDRPANYKPYKDKKKWCKGRVGIEHDYLYEQPKNDSWFLYRLMAICQNCKKQDYSQVLYWCNYCEDWYDGKAKTFSSHWKH